MQRPAGWGPPASLDSGPLPDSHSYTYAGEVATRSSTRWDGRGSALHVVESRPLDILLRACTEDEQREDGFSHGVD